MNGCGSGCVCKCGWAVIKSDFDHEGHEEQEVYNHGYSNSFKEDYRPSSFNASSARELSTTISAVMFCGI